MAKPVWLERTEIVVGLVLKGIIDSNLVNTADLYPPYDELMKAYKIRASKEDAISVGYSLVRDAGLAADSVLETNEISPMEWIGLLETSASFWKHGKLLAEMADKLMAGQKIDAGKLLQFAGELDLGYRMLTPMDQVEPETGQWILTGYRPIDIYFGGIPKASLVALAGGTGIGKTTLALRIVIEMVRLYSGRDGIRQTKHYNPPYSELPIEDRPGKVAVFSLEMQLAQVMARLFDLDESLTKEERSRILGSGMAYTVGEIYAVAARAAASENLKAIVIDFADLLIEGEQSEQAMGVIYRSLAMLAKVTSVPVILVCQFSRKATEAQNGIPKIHHIRYSGMAEMLSAQILLLYNPSSTLADVNSAAILPYYQGKAYIIEGKSRFGFKYGKPGAIQVPFDGESGWGEEVSVDHYFEVHV